MPPGALLAAPAILGGLQTLAGIFTKKGPRPQYQIPGAAQEALSRAKTLAGATTRPGNEQAVDEIKRSEASSIGTLKNTAGTASQLLSGIGKINRNTQLATTRNNAMNAQFRFNANQNLINTLQNYAGYQEKKFYENEMKPYMERVETKNALIGAGMQNIFGGLDNIAQLKMMQLFPSG